MVVHILVKVSVHTHVKQLAMTPVKQAVLLHAVKPAPLRVVINVVPLVATSSPNCSGKTV